MRIDKLKHKSVLSAFPNTPFIHCLSNPLNPQQYGALREKHNRIAILISSPGGDRVNIGKGQVTDMETQRH